MFLQDLIGTNTLIAKFKNDPLKGLQVCKMRLKEIKIILLYIKIITSMRFKEIKIITSIYRYK